MKEKSQLRRWEIENCHKHKEIFDHWMERELLAERIRTLHKEARRVTKKFDYIECEFWGLVEPITASDGSKSVDFDKTDASTIHIIEEKKRENPEDLLADLLGVRRQ